MESEVDATRRDVTRLGVAWKETAFEVPTVPRSTPGATMYPFFYIIFEIFFAFDNQPTSPYARSFVVGGKLRTRRVDIKKLIFIFFLAKLFI